MSTETKNTQVAPAAAVAPAATTIAPPTARIFINLILKKGMPAAIMRKIANMVAPERHSPERQAMMTELRAAVDDVRQMDGPRMYFYFYNMNAVLEAARMDRMHEEELEIAARIADQQREEAERMYQGGDMTNDVAATIAVM
jgi:hypothetical protein